MCGNAGCEAGLRMPCVRCSKGDLPLKSVKNLSISRTCTIKTLDLHRPVNRGGFSFACLVLTCVTAMLNR